MRKTRKFIKGERIRSIDSLLKQEFVFFGDKVLHKSWFINWQLTFVDYHTGPTGRLYYANKKEEST